MTRHEIDVLGRDLLSRHDEVAFGVIIVVLGHHYHTGGPDYAENFLDLRNRHGKYSLSGSEYYHHNAKGKSGCYCFAPRLARS